MYVFEQEVRVDNAGRRLHLGSYLDLDEAKAVFAVGIAEIMAYNDACPDRTPEETEDFMENIDVMGIVFDARLGFHLPGLAELVKTNPAMIVSSNHIMFDIIRDINHYHSLHLIQQDSPLERYSHYVSLIRMGFCFHSVKSVSGKKRPLQSIINGCRAQRRRVLNVEESDESDGYSSPLPPPADESDGDSSLLPPPADESDELPPLPPIPGDESVLLMIHPLSPYQAKSPIQEIVVI